VEQEVEAVPVDEDEMPLPDLEPLEPADESGDEVGNEVGDLPSLDDEAPAEEGAQSE
jgi:hypothetical protein